MAFFQGGDTVEKNEAELVKAGLITHDQLAIAKISKANLGIDLASVLIAKKFITEGKLLEFIAKVRGIAFVSLTNFKVDNDVVHRVQLHIAKQHVMIPLERRNGKVCVAMANPFDAFALDDLKVAFPGEQIEPYLVNSKEIEEAIHQYFEKEQMQPEASNEEGISMEVINTNDADSQTGAKAMQDMASGPKVVATVSNIIGRADADGASDIHIEPHREFIQVRYRIDGLLRDKIKLQKNMLMPIVSRIKILAGLDIAERRVPQDGRVRVKLVGKALDLRISTCPTQHGEKIVIRLLAKEGVRSIEGLGFDEKERKVFNDIITKSNGIFLATGPTGSGKSTTLYAALARINSSEKNIISIEDPIESEIEGINQIAVNIKAGLTFATILRSVLRQDPDVIMLGEIRDKETAEIAVRAAITGHLVLSTLHTNSAAGICSRLHDLGVEPFLLATALKGVLAQRLVRRICKNCKIEVPIDRERYGVLVEKLGKAYHGKGCKDCSYTGYRGRAGIFELAHINDHTRSAIAKGLDDSQIEKTFREANVKSIIQDGTDKVSAGITTIEEVLRVTSED